MGNKASCWAITLVLVCGACSSASDEPPPDACRIEAQKQFVYDLMKGPYLWAEETPPVDIEEFETPAEVLNALAFRKVDRWSGLQSLQARNDFYVRAQSVSTGADQRFDSDGTLRFSWVHPGSPADVAGLSRGLEILEIGGVPIAEVIDNNLWLEVAGPNTEGVVVDYRVRDLHGEEREVRVEKGPFQINTVPITRVLEMPFGRVGYVLFNTFVGTSVAELDEAFAMLKEEGITRLVLDLRYNSGGLLSVAQYLGGLLAGASSPGATLIHESYNRHFRHLDRRLTVAKQPYSLELEDLAILTGPSTASASEQVINGVRPLLNVVLSGTRTFGKPVGADTWVNCETAIVPVTFRSLNSEGEGDFFSGIEPECIVADDLKHQLGDPDEAQLSLALEYLGSGHCHFVPDLAQIEHLRTLTIEQLVTPLGALAESREMGR